MLLKNITIISPSSEQKTDVLIQDGIIKSIGPDLSTDNDQVLEAEGKLLFPGFIDCHVHFREPGFEHKATMKSEAASAVAGGVHTVCEMPNTNPPTVTIAALADKVRRAGGIEDLDMRFFFGMTEPAHLSNFMQLIESGAEESRRLRERCCGVKLYLDHSTGNQKVAAEMVGEVFQFCSQHNIIVVAHCEDPEMNNAAAEANTSSDISAHTDMRPAESEVKAINYAIGLAKQYGTHLHVAHLSTGGGIDAVRKGKQDGVRVTCEVTPHHLFLSTDDYAELGSRVKMNPPIRSIAHRNALWQGIEDGTVDCISTDHAPHTIEEKSTEQPLKAPSGVPGVETMIPLLLSVAGGHWPHPTSTKPETRFTYHDLLRLCFTNPNEIFKLGKSQLVEGAPADIVMIDPKEEWVIDEKELRSKCGWSPFNRWVVRGSLKNAIQES